MDDRLKAAFSKGYERMAAWSNLLDDINLYPVADADTGRNLRISLAPLKSAQHKDLPRNLLMSATGNSGNIAGAFFSKFTQIESLDGILDAAFAGNQAAWSALVDPQPGTMLSVFDTLAKSLQSHGWVPDCILENIKLSVLSTSELLKELRQAGVVDSGALGMFLFFEGFLLSLADRSDSLSNPYELFGTKLRISKPVQAPRHKGYCIDTVLIPSSAMDVALREVSAMGEHVVAVAQGNHLKAHLHADDARSARQKLAAVGQMVRWQSEKIDRRPALWETPALNSQSVHVVTDAAGSVTADVARDLGITLLDSYIVMGDQHLPESTVSAQKLYGAMSRGTRVTTAQASIFERHQHYEYLTQRFTNLLYLCVGSVYTANFEIASRWAVQHRDQSRMTVMDTGAASGRLGLIARRVAGYARSGHSLTRVAEYADAVARSCDELIFLEQLKYLAAGGRISKANGFIGDLLKVKPIIRPGAQGAQKIGAVRSPKDQVEFLLSHLRANMDIHEPAQMLLQYTDNQERVISQIQPRIQRLLPASQISVQPMSLTSGVHMGPGTWAVAFLRSEQEAPSEAEDHHAPSLL
jgi:fatty acid kinase/fatty acid kinase fatty acid binding subunit